MKNKKILLALLLVSFSAISNATASTSNNALCTESSSTKLPKIIYFDAFGNFFEDNIHSSIVVSDIEKNFHEILGLSSDHTLELFSKDTDNLGISHDTYKHYYKGILVDNEMVIIHSKERHVIAINGQITTFEEKDNHVYISDEDAINIAKKDFENENAIITLSEQVFTNVVINEKSEVYLVKKITLNHPENILSITYFIDVVSGKIVNKINNVLHAHVSGSGTTFNRGIKQINVDSQGTNNFRLYDNVRKIHTLNASNATLNEQTATVNNATEFLSTTSTFNNIEQRPALEVHWGIGKTYDYYVNNFSQYGFQKSTSANSNTSIGIKLYYDFQALGPDAGIFNAAAVPIQQSPTSSFMIFGRGGNHPAGIVFKHFVGLDVSGHEYTHLVIDFNGRGGLVYQNESGALNESIADIFGTSVEFFNNENPNWLLGEDIASGGMTDFRNMQFPKESQLSQQPDTYQGEYWSTNLATFNHTNSGVGNKWFYLLSNGGSGTNDVNNQYNVTGITIDKAQQIVYRALMNYLIPNSTYLQARAATIQAAADLYGNNSLETNSVAQAWYAVNVGEITADISDEKFEQNIAVYPNPTKDNFINIDNSILKNTNVELYDIVGKLVKRSIDLYKGNNIYDISGLQSGIYLLKFNIEGESYSKKLIIK